ncbi:hypothetical protein [Azospirillum palustre]|nr:hypothetical protein [Azospirillum palustre]
MTIQVHLHDGPILELSGGVPDAEVSASVKNFPFGSTARPMQTKAHMRPAQMGGEVGR